MLVSKVESATRARQSFFAILDEVAQDSSVVIVKRKDAPNVAMIAESELNSLVETVHLLRSPKNNERLFSALKKSYARDLDSADCVSLANRENDAREALEELRRYCEQTEEENTVEVVSQEQTSKPPY
ncbi:MAG: type II toxin-antitoxin system Phd/YefM family antitoxin [Phormidesmis sp.]